MAWRGTPHIRRSRATEVSNGKAVSGMVRSGMASGGGEWRGRGCPRSARAGIGNAGRGRDCRCLVRQALARRVMVRHGGVVSVHRGLVTKARSGAAERGEPSMGKVRVGPASLGQVRQGMARLGEESARTGQVRCGQDRRGSGRSRVGWAGDGGECHGVVRIGPHRLGRGRRGTARHVELWSGKDCRGMARIGVDFAPQ